MDIQERLTRIQAEVNHQIRNIDTDPWFFVGYRTKHVEKQTQYIQAHARKIAAYAEAQFNLHNLQHRLQQQKQLEDKSFEAKMEVADLVIQQARAQKVLLEIATSLNTDLATYNQYRLNQLNVDVDVDRAKKLGEVDVEKHREMKEIDDEFENRKVKRELSAALAYQQITIEQSKYAMRELLGIVHDLHELEFSGQPIGLIQAKRPYYQMVIEGMKVKLEGLLQGNNQEDLRRSDEDSDSRGLAE